MWRIQNRDRGFLKPLADTLLPTPTKQEVYVLIQGKNNGIRRDSGLSVSLAWIWSSSESSVLLLLVSSFIFSTASRGWSHVQPTTLNTQRVGYCEFSGDPLSLPQTNFTIWTLEEKVCELGYVGHFVEQLWKYGAQTKDKIKCKIIILYSWKAVVNKIK